VAIPLADFAGVNAARIRTVIGVATGQSEERRAADLHRRYSHRQVEPATANNP
jgi:hypothetical protein